MPRRSLFHSEAQETTRMEDAQWMRETAAAKAENKAMRAGMCSLVEIDLRVCMLIMRPWRGPHEGSP